MNGAPGIVPGWDGIFKGQPMNEQVFVYYLVVEYTNGKDGIFKGDFTLLRN